MNITKTTALIGGGLGLIYAMIVGTLQFPASLISAGIAGVASILWFVGFWGPRFVMQEHGKSWRALCVIGAAVLMIVATATIPETALPALVQ